MSLLAALAIVVLASAAAVSVMLLVRRRAPEGSYFNDGDRAAGVFGVLATGFSVLLGFVVFLAFSSYDVTRGGAETEARVVVEQFQSALLLPDEDTDELVAELVCYARSVARVQWERMQAGDLGDAPNPWGVELARTTETIDPQTPSEQAAFSQWLDQTTVREEARQDRIHGAAGVIPAPLWVVLFFITAIIFAYMLFFADSGEGPVVQGMLMGSVVAVIVAMLLLLSFLDQPFHEGFGGLEPVAMERSLVLIDDALDVADLDLVLPCDEEGVAVG